MQFLLVCVLILEAEYIHYDMSKHTLSFPNVVQARNAIKSDRLRTQMEDKMMPLDSPSQGLYNKPKSRVCL